MAKTAEAFLHIGDEIFLYDENANILLAENPLETRACTRPSMVDRHSSESIGSCIFRIEPQQYHTEKRALEQYMGSETMDSIVCNSTEEALHELETLRAKAANEENQNEAEKRRLLGKPVLYGQVIQLYNGHFRKHLTVTGRTCQTDTSRLQVNLSRDAVGLFKIIPRYRIRVDGEPVRLGDTIAIQGIHPEGFLNVNTKPLRSHTHTTEYYEVYSHTRISSWTMKLHHHCSVTNMSQEKTKVINSGQYLRFYHKEMEAYLESDALYCEGSDVRLRKHIINPLDPKESDSPLAFWEIENVDFAAGSRIRWKKPVRIRHASSRSYLYIDSSNARTDPSMAVHSIGLIKDPPVCARSDDITLFTLVPASEPTTSGVPFGNYIRIRHMVTQCWVHSAADLEDSAPAVPTAVVTLSLPPEPPVNHDSVRNRLPKLLDVPYSNHESEALAHEVDVHSHLADTHDTGAPFLAVHSVTASQCLYYHDCFSITLVDDHLADTFNVVNELLPCLQQFLRKERRAELEHDIPFSISDAEFDAIMGVLNALVLFCTKSKETDPTQRVGLPIEYHQGLLRDIGIIETVIQMIQVPFGLERRSVLCSAARSISKTRRPDEPEQEELVASDILHGKQGWRLKQILKLCYNLLRIFLVGGSIHEDSDERKRNQRQVLTMAGDDGIRLFIEHLTCDVGAASMMINLVQDNAFVVESILATASDILPTLIRLVRASGSHAMDHESTCYVRLLNAICLVETMEYGMQMSTSEFVFKHLMEQPELLQTRMTRETGLVELCILSETWYDIDILFLQRPEMTTFVESLLGLFAAIAQSANSKTHAKLCQYIKWDICLKCLGNVKLPSQIRAKFCELLRVLYINVSRYSEVVLSDFTLQYAALEESDAYPSGLSIPCPEFFDLLRRWLFVFLDDTRHQFSEDHENVDFLSAVLKLIDTQLRLGFFVSANDIKTLFRLLVHVLDGQTDARNKEHAKFLTVSSAQWAERFTLTEDNQRVMNTKIQILEIFDLIFNLRLQVRMKKLAAAWKEMETNMDLHNQLSLRGTLSEIFNETMLRERERSLMPILKDILQYQYTPLKHIAVVVMHRMYKDCEDLFKKAPQVLIISHPHQVVVYNCIQKRLLQLQSFFSADRLALDDFPDVLCLLEEFSALFGGYTFDINGTLCLLDEDNQKGIYGKILKNLNAHTLVIQLLKAVQKVMRSVTSTTSTARTAIDEHCMAIMKACLDFVFEIIQDDTELQGTFVLENLDLLIDISAHGPVLALGVYKICKNNLHISLRVREEQIQCILELSKGEQGEYLHLLLDFMKVNGKLIKKNQNIIMRLIMDNQSLYIPFRTAEELVVSTKMYYCLQLVEVLSVCGQGDNAFGQSFARTIFSIQDIASVIQNKETPLELGTKMLRFVSSVYLENIDVPSHVPVSENRDIRQLMEIALSDMISAKDNMTPENTDYVYHGILVFLRSLFEYHISLETTVDKALFTLCPKLVDLAVDLLDAAKDDLILIQGTVVCLDSMINVSGFRGSVAPEILRDKLREAMVKVTDGAKKTYQPPDTMNAKFQGFIRALQVAKGVIDLQAEEFRQLVSHFNLVHVSSEKDVKSLIDYLSMMATTSKIHSKSESYQIATIQLLENIPLHATQCRTVIEPSNAKQHETLDVRKLSVQNALNRLGCTLVAQNLLSSPRRYIFEAALKLLIALLEDGNKNVQDKLEEYFYSIREERFFYSFHQRLQNGIISLEEARTHLLHASYKLNRQQCILSLESFDSTMKSNFMPNHHRRYSPNMDKNIKGRKRSKSQSQVSKTEAASIYQNQKISNLMASDTAEFGTANADFEGMKNTMRAIQLMVEGHNKNLQTYLAKQPDNIKSFNIVQDVVGYLHAIAPLCNVQNVRLIIQVLDTITELAQGCLENQVTIFNGKIINPVNTILREPYANCQSTLISELKSKVVICLLSLLEGGIDNSETVFRDMAASLDLTTVMENMDAVYEKNAQNLDSHDAFQKLECGFLYCMLVMTLMPAFDEAQQRTIEKVKSFEYFQKNTGKIEIVMEYGPEKQLSRVLFPIPEICKHLPESTKQSFLWNVKRDSPSSKIEDFVQQTGNIIYEIENQARIGQNTYLSLMTEYSSLWWKASYATTILLNILILSYPAMLFASHEALYVDSIRISHLIRFLLGLAHLTLWFFSAAEFCFIELPILVNRHAVKTTEAPLDFLQKVDDNSIENTFSLFEGYFSHKQFNLAFLSACISEPQFVYHAIMVGFSIIGLRYPGFYALHLLDFVFRDRILQGVISSITLNVNSITRTALLGIIVVYVHSVIAFKYFSNEFDESKGLLCRSLFECFITVLTHGVRSGGGIGDILEPTGHLDVARGWRIMFEMSFYLVVVVFLLNAIFGIIFDTFGHLRDERSSVQQDMKSSCFICSIPAVEFQRHAKKGFEDHIKNDHNIWQYLFFFVHLRNKDRTEYTGPESYVAACLKDSNYGFFPINRALCLRQHEGDDEERLEKLEELAMELMKKMHKMEAHLDRMNDGQARSRSNSILLSPV